MPCQTKDIEIVHFRSTVPNETEFEPLRQRQLPDYSRNAKLKEPDFHFSSPPPVAAIHSSALVTKLSFPARRWRGTISAWPCAARLRHASTKRCLPAGPPSFTPRTLLSRQCHRAPAQTSQLSWMADTSFDTCFANNIGSSRQALLLCNL